MGMYSYLPIPQLLPSSVLIRVLFISLSYCHYVRINNRFVVPPCSLSLRYLFFVFFLMRSLMSFQTHLPFVNDFGLNFRLLRNQSFNRLFQNIDFSRRNTKQFVRINAKLERFVVLFCSLFFRYTKGNYIWTQQWTDFSFYSALKMSWIQSRPMPICYFWNDFKNIVKNKQQKQKKQEWKTKNMILRKQWLANNRSYPAQSGSALKSVVSQFFGHFSNENHLGKLAGGFQSTNKGFAVCFFFNNNFGYFPKWTLCTSR